MDDRRKTIAALTIVIGIIVLVVVVVGLVISGRNVVSPVPDEGAIRVIFMSPTAVAPQTTDTVTPQSAAKPSPKPTAKITSTPKPTVAATTTPTDTPKPTTTPASQ